MDNLFLANLASPPLLFFFLGALAAWVRSDLEVPTAVAKAVSLYLLLAIGFKGGTALAASPLDATVWLTLATALALAAVVPLGVFLLVRRRLPLADAAAVAATYGSISAVTFVTGTSYLDSQGVAWGGHLVAAMALMESPAIIIGLLLYRLQGGNGSALHWGELGRDACLNGAVLLITGSLLVGWLTGARGAEQLAPFTVDLFPGLLCLFLLDMGLVAARRLREALRLPGGVQPLRLAGWGVLLALGNGALGMACAVLLGLPEGDAVLLTLLAASASYIAVPAAMRLSLPDANPGIYLTMSLAVTFPFNLLVGIPLYHQLLRSLLG